jgi:hypothetical protein
MESTQYVNAGIVKDEVVHKGQVLNQLGIELYSFQENRGVLAFVANNSACMVFVPAQQHFSVKLSDYGVSLLEIQLLEVPGKNLDWHMHAYHVLQFVGSSTQLPGGISDPVHKLQCLVYPMPTIGRLLGCISIVCLKHVLATHANLLRVAKCWIVALVQAQVTSLKSRTRFNFGADAIYIQSSKGVVVIFLCLPELLEHNMVLLKCFDDDTSMILSSCGYKIWIVKELEHDKKLVNTWIVHTHISVGTVNSVKDSDSGQDDKAIYCSFQGAYELSFSTIIDNSREVSSLLHSFASSWNVYHIVAISPMLKSEIDFELKEQPEPHCLPLKHNRCSMILTENIIIFSSNANQLLNCHCVKLHLQQDHCKYHRQAF